jgi:hypothetical protein
MKTGAALQWANRHFDKFGHQLNSNWPTWTEFMTQLDAMFSDHDAENKA